LLQYSEQSWERHTFIRSVDNVNYQQMIYAERSYKGLARIDQRTSSTCWTVDVACRQHLWTLSVRSLVPLGGVQTTNSVAFYHNECTMFMNVNDGSDYVY